MIQTLRRNDTLKVPDFINKDLLIQSIENVLYLQNINNPLSIKSMLLSEAIEKFFAAKRLEICELSMKDYRVLLNNFIQKIGDCHLSEIDENVVLEYLNSKQLSFITFNNYRKRFHTFFNYLHKKRLISENPIFYIDYRKPNRLLGERRPVEVPKNLPSEIVKEIISRFKKYSSLKYYSFVCFLAATGARPAEARKLTKQNVKETEANLALTKTYIPRIVFYPEQVGKTILEYANSHNSPYIWHMDEEESKPMPYSGFKKVWDELRMGLFQPVTGQLITPYMLRHTFATDLIGVVDATEASKYLGNSPESLKNYQHANREKRLEIYQKIEHKNIFN